MAFTEFIKDFLAESLEILERLDQDFVAVESNPSDQARVESIYGGVHTIKGSAGFFAFNNLETLAHAGENILSLIADGKLELTPAITTALLSMVDAVREMLTVIERTGKDGDREYSEIIDVLKALREGGAPVDADTPEEPGPSDAEVPEEDPNDVDDVDGLPDQSMEILFDGAKNQPEQAPIRSVADSTIRVSVDLLDKLMGLVGELVLARNQVLQYTSSIAERACVVSLQQLDLITTDLQQTIMKTRMQPIRNIFNKFPRIVRDLAISCNKKVRLELEGQDTELDKSLIEAINAPLTHIVRNAIDHGIESPEERRKVGKPGEGRLWLSSFHESGHVNIEICDDGAGIDLDAIRQKAVLRGLISQEQASFISEAETINLIFAPGLSTSATVTNISGRGMGMDVVRSNLEKIGGTFDIQSRRGEGTTIKIKIPLTLAIIPALIVSTRLQRFAIPQVHLREAVHLKGAQVEESIDELYETQVYRLRGRLLPLAHLSQVLGLAGPGRERTEDGRATSMNIVILQLDECQFGLVVDEISDTQEIVVKPIGKLLKENGCYAGATIMDDGKPALILDVLRLAQRARVFTDRIDKPLFEARIEESRTPEVIEIMLIFETPARSRMAMSLSCVGRLEVFSMSQVEKSGTHEVTQYRDQIMPLIRVSDFLGEPPVPGAAREEQIHVVVYHHRGRPYGLVVGRILDVVGQVLDVKGDSTRAGVVGTAVIRDRVTEILDAEVVVEGTLARFLPTASTSDG
ncbi:MAG: chemotaxis protein CheA [Pseudomonadota bacterium]